MWNENEASNYEGLFAQTPDRSEDTVWGRTETHSNPFGSDTIVKRDWLGEIRSIEESNW
jgi:hypothetical protein